MLPLSLSISLSGSLRPKDENDAKFEAIRDNFWFLEKSTPLGTCL